MKDRNIQIFNKDPDTYKAFSTPSILDLDGKLQLVFPIRGGDHRLRPRSRATDCASITAA